MPINWDASMDRKLFLAILKVHDISVDTKAVANELSTDDQPCTAMAIQKRLQKIKTQIKEGTGGEGDSGDGAGTPKSKGKATPRKRAAATDNGAGEESPTKKAKGKGGKAKKDAAEDDDAEEGGPETVVKEEANDDDGTA